MNKYFEAALKEALKASTKNEVPIGAVLVRNGQIVSRAHNLTEQKSTFLAHAEILCLLKAASKLRSKFIGNAQLYVTVEPCLMCEFAARLCRIESIHYLARSAKFGRNKNRYFKTLRRRCGTVGQRKRAVDLLQDFFRPKRSLK